MSFALAIRIFFFVLLVLSAVVGRRVIRWVQAFGKDDASRRRLKWISIGTWVFLNLATIYFVVMGLRTRGSIQQTWHMIFLYPWFAWLVTSVALAAILTAKGIIALPYRIAQWWKRKQTGEQTADGDRREFLAKAATALPAAMLLTSGYGIVRAQSDFDWFEPELKLKDWPKELEGLRIMQISDPHVGNFMPGEKFAGLIEQINQRPCDMLVLTGDIINNNMAWMPECMEAMHKLKLPRYGAYVCIGNHDYFAGGPEEILQGMRDLGMTVVRDDHVVVPIGNSKINVAGIDYPMWSGGHGLRGTRLEPRVDTALAGRDPEAPTIMLAHHPHAFDRAAEHGVQLTLAGHTHGGQFAFSYPGGKTVSLGDLMFRYVAGEYQKNGSYLYVNRGIGNWFPMRLGAPPEVTRITVG